MARPMTSLDKRSRIDKNRARYRVYSELTKKWAAATLITMSRLVLQSSLRFASVLLRESYHDHVASRLMFIHCFIVYDHQQNVRRTAMHDNTVPTLGYIDHDDSGMNHAMCTLEVTIILQGFNFQELDNISSFASLRRGRRPCKKLQVILVAICGHVHVSLYMLVCNLQQGLTERALQVT
jgi:hypothetical protein